MDAERTKRTDHPLSIPSAPTPCRRLPAGPPCDPPAPCPLRRPSLSRGRFGSRSRLSRHSFLREGPPYFGVGDARTLSYNPVESPGVLPSSPPGLRGFPLPRRYPAKRIFIHQHYILWSALSRLDPRNAILWPVSPVFMQITGCELRRRGAPRPTTNRLERSFVPTLVLHCRHGYRVR